MNGNQQKRKETKWLFKVDMTEVPERCTRLSVQIAKKSVKFPSNPEKIVLFIARNVFQSIRTAVVKREQKFFSQPDGNPTIKSLTPVCQQAGLTGCKGFIVEVESWIIK